MGAGSARDRRRAFPLVPRRHLIGLPFGQVPSRRRGRGSDVIGHRPYERGDPVATIDWPASARLSATSGTDAFVVRDNAADEAPRVVIVIDRRPAMALYPEPLPWLAKRDALRETALAISISAALAQADLAALDFGAGAAWWLPPGQRERRWLVADREGDAPFGAPDDTLELSLSFLDRRRAQLPSGSFVFLLSDFLVPPSSESLRRAVGNGWDLVPVVIQDPVWERSFPAVSGVAVPVCEPGGHQVRLVRLGRRQAMARREANVRRYEALLRQFAAFEVRPVVIGTSEPQAIDTLFIEWSSERSGIRRAR